MVTMRGPFVVLLAVLLSAFPYRLTSAQSKDAVPLNARTRIAEAEIAKDRTVRIRFNNGRSIQVQAEKGHAERERLLIAASRSSVGWLVDDTPVGSYSVPAT